MLQIFPPVKRSYIKPLKVIILMEERQLDRRDGRQGDRRQGDLLPSGDIPQRRIRRSRKNVNPTATKSINITDNVNNHCIYLFSASRSFSNSSGPSPRQTLKPRLNSTSHPSLAIYHPLLNKDNDENHCFLKVLSLSLKESIYL